MNNNAQSIHLKKEILIRLVKAFFSEDFAENTRLIPYDMRPKGAEVPYRCCIYKERAILKDRAIAGLGFQIEEDDERKSLHTYAKEALKRTELDNRNLTVLQAACKGCVPSQIHVTDLCQGCVARPCEKTCKFGAISIVDGKSHIDTTKCKKCKMCMNACPYSAIVQTTVPCEAACPVGAISKDETGFASIDFEKCISCGKCIAACPFGAVHEKSQLIDILKAIKSDKKVVAMIAPSIVGQFPGTLYQLKTAIVKAGFDDVIEVAQGADITTKNEAAEFKERMEEGASFMTTSCCAAYNNLVAKHLPEIKPFVSTTKTPLYYTAELVKKAEPETIAVFVSPCVAKRSEGKANDNVDFVMSYEELGALFIGRQIDVLNCEETQFETTSSKQGRNFGVSGGVAKAVQFLAPDAKPCIINGLNKATIKELKQYATKNECPNCNIVEVMSCESGCCGGNATINQPRISAKQLNQLLENSEDITE